MSRENKKMLFEVKVEVIETHYLSIDANSKEDAEEQAESYSPDPDNAHTVDVNVISIMENENE